MRQQLPSTKRNEVSVHIRENAPITQQGQVYLCAASIKGLQPTEFVWLDNNAWDLEAYLMAQRSLKMTHTL